MSDTIILECNGASAAITLNIPAKHNRLGPAELMRLMQCLDQVAGDAQIRCLVITGAGERSFCAGFDIGAIDSAKEASGPGFEALVDRIETMPMPVVAALNGGVFGGATDLALACDFRLGVTGMRLFVPPAKLGLHYYPNGLRRFVERLGPGVAKRMFLLAEEFDAEELMRVGYLDWLVAPDRLRPRCAELVENLVGMAPLALRGMKRAINQIARGTLDTAATRAAIAEAYASQDLQEGLAAHREKRKPIFQGR
ncbi:MAG: enoyl-CoA hydratase/isomerase family protein [Rhodospirillales bacterium]